MTRPAVAVWSPLPPSPSGIADYVAEQLPALMRHADVRAISREPDVSAKRTVVDERGGASARRAEDAGAVTAELDVYHVGNSPAHAWVYRAALRRPGVVVLHDWSLHQLVLCETVERGDVSSYLREMRRAHGETGSFVGRQVARALGGTLLPALYPVNERLLEGALGIVALSQSTAARVASACRGGRCCTCAITSRFPSTRCPRAPRPAASWASARGRS